MYLFYYFYRSEKEVTITITYFTFKLLLKKIYIMVFIQTALCTVSKIIYTEKKVSSTITYFSFKLLLKNIFNYGIYSNFFTYNIENILYYTFVKNLKIKAII